MRLTAATAGSAEAGFTLVELLVALALFGLLSLALFGSIRVGMTAWMHGTTRADQVDQSLHAQTLLRQLIEDSYPLFIPEQPVGGHVYFGGTSHSLDFLASTPMALGTGGRSRFNLTVEPHGDLADLVLSSNLELAWPESASQPATKALLRGVERAEFSYFGTARSDRVAAWHADWSGQTALPQLMRIQVRFPANDPRVWPELLIAPRIAADVGCQYDPLTDRCRGR
jgi:general secretion pathway protein J